MPDPSIARFRRAVASACAELEGRRQEVNDLNVFPVADGDTGDNMAMTLRAVLSELDRINGQHIDEVGRSTVVDAVAQDELLADVLERALDAGLEAVERGPEQLPALREAGVVDAGAYGLTVIVAGVIGALRGDAPPELEHHTPPAGALVHRHGHES